MALIILYRLVDGACAGQSRCALGPRHHSRCHTRARFAY
jgi:hypothetical protein